MCCRGNRGEKKKIKNEAKAFFFIILAGDAMEPDGEATQNFSFGMKRGRFSFMPVRNSSGDVK